MKSIFSRRQVCAAAAGVVLLLGAALPAGAAEPDAVGLWQRSEDGKPEVWVLMLDRGGGLYEGVVAKTFPKPGEPVDPVCDECEGDRKNVPVLGISLIRDMKRKGLVYEGGNILDPRNGDVWKAKLTVSPDGQKLTLRGYLMTPMLGKDDIWDRLPDTAVAQLDPAIVAKYLPTQAAAAKAAPPAKRAAPSAMAPAPAPAVKPAPIAPTKQPAMAPAPAK